MPTSPKRKSQDVFRFTTVLERSSNRLWGCEITVPASVAQELTANGNKRVFCSLNGTEEHQAGLVLRNGRHLIMVNKTRRKDLGLEAGDEIAVSLRTDESDFGLPMPDELGELLRQDREGKKYFDALTAGKKRTLLYIVGSVKNPDKRMGRALVVVEHLKKHKGIINYKILYSNLRNPSPRK